jgi:ribonuclease P protein component
MLNRKFRLTRSIDFKRVKQNGKSFAHPLLVLVKRPNPDGTVRIGITAGRAVGNAVLRNKAKRRIRASLNSILSNLQPGWDLVFLARHPITEATYTDLLASEMQLLKRAGLLLDESELGHGSSA